MKYCSKCKKEKPLEEFAVRQSAKDGRQFYCKECMGRLMVKRYKENPEPFKRSNQCVRDRVAQKVNDIKKKLGCQVPGCFEREPICLDFHHVKKKNRDVSYWVRVRSLPKALKEISRCVCVCANHHRKIHAGIVMAPKLI